MATATITSKHQVTIPREVCRQMNLHEGDQIEFTACGTGNVVLTKRVGLKPSDGAAAKFIKRKKRLSVEEMKAAARAGALKSFKSERK